MCVNEQLKSVPNKVATKCMFHNWEMCHLMNPVQQSTVSSYCIGIADKKIIIKYLSVLLPFYTLGPKSIIHDIKTLIFLQI